ncbi:hypothetical protein [Myxococcus landrumensis]|uniref:Immunity protein Imm1 n=1 Tax=Myxococcus landrumensis TaxID=2813577 RepID=A0ABX7N6H9_9BACT|nr:hypothetical protein [Myxococcus landrumus]QSQ14019.1 hypothetical protein JY572_37850 [Myxococcus landrumus]
MAENRALVAVTPDDRWVFLGWKGGAVEYEVSEVGQDLADNIEFPSPMPYGLSVMDFAVGYTHSPGTPDSPDEGGHAYAREVTARRPTPDELAALLTDGPEALHALWGDVTSTWPPEP